MSKALSSQVALITVTLGCLGSCKPDMAALSSGGNDESGGSSGKSNVSGNAGKGGVTPSNGGVPGSVGGNGSSLGGATATAGGGAGGSAGSSGVVGGAGQGKAGSAGAAGTTATCTIAPFVPGEPPKLKYDFDTGSGDVAVDSSGNSLDGTLLGAPTWSATGRIAGALSFGASNQFVLMPQDVLASLDAVTVATWVKLSANPSGATLFDFGTSATNHFYLRTNDSAGAGITFGAQVNGGTANDIVTGYSLQTSVWHHIALAVGEGRATLYIDGLPVTSRPLAFVPSALGSTTGNWIGRTHSNAVNLWGNVDDFRIYPRVLESREIEALAPPGTDYIHFNFDEPCGAKAFDRSAKALVAELPAGGGWTSGRVGGALSLSGTSQYLKLPANIVQSCNDLTVAMWVQRTSNAAWERLFSVGQAPASSMSLSPMSTLNVMHFAAKLNGGELRGSADEQQLASPSRQLSPQMGLWGHVAVVLQAGTGRLYFGGQEVATGSITIRPSDLGATSINNVGLPLYLGEPYLAANIDDMRISCRAYPPSEIKILALVAEQ